MAIWITSREAACGAPPALDALRLRRAGARFCDSKLLVEPIRLVQSMCARLPIHGAECGAALEAVRGRQQIPPVRVSTRERVQVTERRVQVIAVRKSSAASWPVWRREAVERALRVARHGGGRMCLAEVDPDIEVVLTADGTEEAVLRLPPLRRWPGRVSSTDVTMTRGRDMCKT